MRKTVCGEQPLTRQSKELRISVAILVASRLVAQFHYLS